MRIFGSLQKLWGPEMSLSLYRKVTSCYEIWLDDLSDNVIPGLDHRNWCKINKTTEGEVIMYCRGWLLRALPSFEQLRLPLMFGWFLSSRNCFINPKPAWGRERVASLLSGDVSSSLSACRFSQLISCSLFRCSCDFANCDTYCPCFSHKNLIMPVFYDLQDYN